MNIGNIMNAYQYGIQSYGRVSAQTTPYYNMDQKTFLDHLNGAKENADNSLADIGALSKGYSAGRPGATNFADAFLRYDVTTHTGNANISDAHWQRNDFPVWRYFDKSATADCLNDWKPMGANPPQTDSRIQRGLSGIGAGKMSIIIPEALQEKMDADENYAKEIMNKVQKWKEDYDNWDNASALSLGMNVAEHQASKSYVLNLDEDGNIKQYTVIGGGGRISGPSKEELRQIEAEKKSKMKKEAAQKRIAAERSKKAADEQRRIEAETYHRQLLASAYENQALCLDAGGFYAYWNM